MHNLQNPLIPGKETDFLRGRVQPLSETLAQLLNAQDPDTVIRELFPRIRHYMNVDSYLHYAVDENGRQLFLHSSSGIPEERLGPLRCVEYGSGICGNVAVLHRPLIFNDIQDSRDSRLQPLRDLGIQTCVSNPLIVGEKFLGTLSFASRSRTSFTDDELEFTRIVTQYAAATLDRLQKVSELANTRDDLGRQVNSLQRLYELSTTLSHLSELKPSLLTILRALLEYHEADSGVVSLIDKTTGHLYEAASLGFTPEALQSLVHARRGVENGAYGSAFWSKERVVVEDTAIDPRFEAYREFAKEAGFRAVHSTPIFTRSGEVLGVLSVQFTRPRVPTSHEMQFADMCARKVSVAAENASLYEAIQKELSEHKETEESLRVSEQRYRAIADDLEERVKERTLQLELQSSRLRVLADQLVATEQKERKRIAAIIHDHLQQLLVAGKFQLAQAMRNLRENSPEKLSKNLSRSDEFLNQAIEASRSLTVELRPPVLYEDGLLAAFRWLAQKFETEHNLHLVLNLDEVPISMPDRLKIMLFESVKELLFNVVKHARVSRAALTFRYHRGDSFYLGVEDEGSGFDVEQEVKTSSERGMGLFSIRERLKLLNADFKITSGAGSGTRVEIRIPLDAALLKEEQEQGSQKHMRHEEPHPRSENAIKILLADDHKIVREGIANILQEKPELHVIAQAENGLDAVEKAAAFQPDVIIMDVNMPKLNGIEATRRIKNEFPHIQIIGLSVLDESGVADSMKNAGAITLLNKAGDTQELIDTILRSVKSEAS